VTAYSAIPGPAAADGEPGAARPSGLVSGPVAPLAPSRRYGQRCPHCRTAGEIRSSTEAHPTLTVIYFSCRNPACGHTWRASLVYDFGLSPSAIPDPALDLPLKPLSRRDALRILADAQAKPDPDQPGLFGP
jgi:hypothetical protein